MRHLFKVDATLDVVVWTQFVYFYHYLEDFSDVVPNGLNFYCNFWAMTPVGYGVSWISLQLCYAAENPVVPFIYHMSSDDWYIWYDIN